MTASLYAKYYPQDRFEGGSLPFYRLCRQSIAEGSQILEVGAGPSNEFSQVLSKLGPVVGLDVDPDVQHNQWLQRAVQYDGTSMPFADASFDACCSNFVLEHVSNPEEHFREIARVLRPGGALVLRTPNLFHYVSMAAHLLPHAAHLLLANRLRSLPKDAHDPYPTRYRANTRRRLRSLVTQAGFQPPVFIMIEPEPAYGSAHPALFYPMMMYERLVNSWSGFADARVTILLAATKSA